MCRRLGNPATLTVRFNAAQPLRTKHSGCPKGVIMNLKTCL